jgi:hypothetical protein
MSDERVFLSHGDVYVSNTRVVLRGTTYATANITSVRNQVTPPQQGCAVVLILVGGLAALGSVISLFTQGSDTFGAFVTAAVLLAAGIAWYRSAKAMHHVFIASAGGERQGYSSYDGSLVHRVTEAIANAIVSRG